VWLIEAFSYGLVPDTWVPLEQVAHNSQKFQLCDKEVSQGLGSDSVD
jgi:hypothetical protein